MSEFMMTGLRLTQEGISEAEFQARFGIPIHDVYGKEMEELLKLGLIEWHSVGAASPGRPPLRITKRGRLLGNQVFMRFIGETN
jgi:oxygen-independent coproporphyrinogen-3 oxidase